MLDNKRCAAPSGKLQEVTVLPIVLPYAPFTKDWTNPRRPCRKGCATFNNERGDDYLEQIGMPDEENMRHWSHHHSPDTVDDPVFRAAMRATNTVSFVFGLEVTWSLIQQRKQDEEDRKAMEAIQEAGEEEFVCSEAIADDDDADDEEKKMDLTFATINEVKDDSPSDESKASAWRSPKDENTRPSPTYKTLEVPTPDTNLSQSDDSIVEAIIMSSQKSSQPSIMSSQSSPATTEWECSTCTLFNKKSLRKCDACGTKRPKMGVKRPLVDVIP